MNKIKTKIVKQLLDRLIISTNGILPTMTTRPDVMGVVVEDER